jgi:hypothetical protein
MGEGGGEVRTVINGLSMALSIIPTIAVKNPEAKRWRDCAYKYIQLALDELKASPRRETPEQYRKRTGKPWPDNWAVYYRYVLNGVPRDSWRVGNYKNISYSNADFRQANAGYHQIVCAGDAGPPPDDLEPEELPEC